MLAWLHKQFIPHEGNGHRPHFLRPKNGVKILAAVVFLEVFLLSNVYIFPQFKDFLAAVLPGVLVDLANGSRIDANAGNLAVNPLLVVSAQMKAEDMAKNGYFAHDSPAGISPWFWFNKSGYKFLYAGENLAVHFVDSEDVHRAWMASQTHRANILNPNFIEIGIGIAQGVFQGRSAIFIVQHFGRPYSAPASQNPLLTIGNTPGSAQNNVAGISEEINKETKQAEPVMTETAQSSEIKSDAKKTGVSGEFAGSITIPEPSLLQKIFSMPRNLTAFAYYFALLVIAVALILKIFIKIRIQYPSLILTGLALAFVISGFIAANYYLINMPGNVL